MHVLFKSVQEIGSRTWWVDIFYLESCQSNYNHKYHFHDNYTVFNINIHLLLLFYLSSRLDPALLPESKNVHPDLAGQCALWCTDEVKEYVMCTERGLCVHSTQAWAC